LPHHGPSFDSSGKPNWDALDETRIAAAEELRALLGAPVVEHQPACYVVKDRWGVNAYLEESSEALKIRRRLGFTDEVPLYTAPPEVAALQSTIAQLQARVQELESGKVEILADGIQTLERIGASIDARQQRIDALTAPPAPVATLWEICMPDEPGNPESPCEYVYVNSIAGRDLLLQRDGSSVYAEYACLDATAALNEGRK